MKKIVLFLALVYFINANLFAQWYEFLPMNSSFLAFNDTAINSSIILKNAGVKKIMVYKNAPRGEVKSFLNYTSTINENGAVKDFTDCLQNVKKDTFYCYKYFFQYNIEGKRSKYFFTQDEKIYQSEYYTYINKNFRKSISIIISDPKIEKLDTLRSEKYYNDKGEIIKSNSYFNSSLWRTDIYSYSSEGFLDSINYLQKPPATFPNTTIFTRYSTNNTSVLKVLENPYMYKWSYNKNGQCFKLEIAITEFNAGLKMDESKYKKQTVVHYNYNKDGTLRTIFEENKDARSVKLFYYYLK